MTDTTDADTPKNDGVSGYAVGKGKPPLHTRFKPGHSGNKSGRPKGSKNIKTLILEEFESKVTVVENGKRRKISKIEATIKNFVNRAVQGDHRVAGFLLDIIGPQDVADQALPALTADQIKLFEGHLRTIVQGEQR